MSAFGIKRTWADAVQMSADHPKRTWMVVGVKTNRLREERLPNVVRDCLPTRLRFRSIGKLVAKVLVGRARQHNEPGPYSLAWRSDAIRPDCNMALLSSINPAGSRGAAASPVSFNSPLRGAHTCRVSRR